MKNKLIGIIVILFLLSLSIAYADIPKGWDLIRPNDDKGYVTTKGAAAIWHLDGNTGDSVGNHRLVRKGVSYSGGISNEGTEFNGNAGSYLEANTTDGLNVTKALTVSAWVFPRSAPDGVGRLVASTYRYAGGGSNLYGWSLGNEYGNADKFQFRVYNSSNHSSFPGGSAPAVSVDDFFADHKNNWTYVVGVFKPSKYVKLYVNGEEAASNTTDIIKKIAYDPSTPLRIGHRADNELQGMWDGLIDEVAIYNRALRPEEIKELYEEKRARDQRVVEINKNGTTTDEVSYGIKREVFVKNNKDYTLSSYVSCRFGGLALLSVNGSSLNKSVFNPHGSWYPVNITFNSGSNDIITITARLNNTKVQRICQFDNIKLEELPQTAELNQITDSPRSCCTEDSCWNGTTCVGEFAPYTKRGPMYGYRCIEGEWQESPLKYTPDWSDTGYCPYSTQCLFDTNGFFEFNAQPREFYKGSNPQCINDSQYIADSYCLSGAWSSRTRQLALRLLNFTAENNLGNYTLYCDEPDKALADIGYAISEEPLYLAEDYIYGRRVSTDIGGEKKYCFKDKDIPCVNNFCILKYEENSKEKAVMATSTNIPINDSELSILIPLGSNPSVCEGTTDFGNCRGNTIWYDANIESVFYAKESIELQSTGIINAIQSFLQDLWNFIKGESPEGIAEIDISTGKFNRYFDLNIGNRSVKGIVEELRLPDETAAKRIMTIEYINFSEGICDYINITPYVNRSVDLKGNVYEEEYFVNCSYDPSTKVTSITSTEDRLIDPLWQYLTSRLRVS